MLNTSAIDVKFPAALQFLFEPYRYKVLYGGRGSGKSWGVAMALLILGAQNKERILCTREVQDSIKDSVHRLLADQIEKLGLGGFYEILNNEIRGRNGTLFLFSGLSNETAESIKSKENISICWVEEAQSVTKRSWDILVPTIRGTNENGESAEIWVTFNPELDTDETYVRFVTNPPPKSCVKLVNYTENPWFPQVLEDERMHSLATDPEDYAQIWEGKCRTAVSGAIYASEIQDAVRNNRICNVPYDPRLKVHTIWDLGWNDAMTIILCQKLRSEIRVIDYIEDSHKTLDWYVAELQKKNLNWGVDWLPHDGDNEDFKTGKSAKTILQSFGRKVKIVPQIGVESGIKMARMSFNQVYFDKEKCKRLLECLKRYRRHINAKTQEAGQPLHDSFSHGADSFRYLAVAADKLTNEEESAGRFNNAGFTPLVNEYGY